VRVEQLYLGAVLNFKSEGTKKWREGRRSGATKERSTTILEKGGVERWGDGRH